MSGTGPVPSRQEAPHPHMALVDPTGNFMVIPDLGADLIRIYSIEKSSGILTSCGNYTAEAGSGPRHGTWFVPPAGTGIGTVLYIGNELANTVSAFAVTYTANCLGFNLTQDVPPYPGGKAVTGAGIKVGEVRVQVRSKYHIAKNINH
jgi:6-phosphogluconolactonase (cycloisomerase 2 family)